MVAVCEESEVRERRVAVKRKLFVQCLAIDVFAFLPPSPSPHSAMAYNNRDWDRGKESWDNTGAWNDPTAWNNNAGGKGNARGREEDYQSEGKRRKFNDGVRQLSRHLSLQLTIS